MMIDMLPELKVPCLEDISKIIGRCENLGVRISEPVFPPKSENHKGKKRMRLNGKTGTTSDISIFCDGSDNSKPKKNGEYEVESILDLRIRDGQMYYYVKWKGWSSEMNTWEPRNNLANCTHKLEKFHEEFVGIRLNSKQKNRQNVILDKHHHAQHLQASKKKLGGSNKHKNGFARTNYLSLMKKWNKMKNPELTKMETNTYKRLKMNYSYKQKRRNLLARLKEWEKQINSISEEAYISIENSVDLEGPPLNFTYINDYKPDKDIVIPDDPLVGCDCAPDCYKNRDNCCAHQSGGQYAYSPFGRVKLPKGSPIYECNRRCACPPDCRNRVVQHGRKVKLAIFRTSNGRGWGVKALHKIKKGTFVMEYVGEVITNEEAENRGKVYDAEGRTYLFDLDYNDGDCPFTVDAALYGNVSHFMNHSCEPNLSVYGVWINTLDPRLPRIAFFANKMIERGEELTFDYMMTGDTTLAARSIPKEESDLKRIPCKCGSKQCRKYLF